MRIVRAAIGVVSLTGLVACEGDVPPPVRVQPPASTESGAAITLTFVGNAAIHLTDGRLTLITDFPYRSGAFGYMTYARDQATAFRNVVTPDHPPPQRSPRD